MADDRLVELLSEHEHDKWMRYIAKRISKDEVSIEQLIEWNPMLYAYQDLKDEYKEIYRARARNLLDTIDDAYELENNGRKDPVMESEKISLEEFDKTRGLQELYSPQSVCFGCGPANPDGLHIKSVAHYENVVSYWKPSDKYNAFGGVLSGGIVSTLLDCHSNFSAAYHLMLYRNQTVLIPSVTSEYKVRFKRPTPINSLLYIVSKPLIVTENYAIVISQIVADGKITATSIGKFVAVKEGHPAFNRWGNFCAIND